MNRIGREKFQEHSANDAPSSSAHPTSCAVHLDKRYVGQNSGDARMPGMYFSSDEVLRELDGILATAKKKAAR